MSINQEYIGSYNGISLKIHQMEKPKIRAHACKMGETTDEFINRAIEQTLLNDLDEPDRVPMLSAFNDILDSQQTLALGSLCIPKIKILSYNTEEKIREFIVHALRETMDRDCANSDLITLALNSKEMSEEQLATSLGLSLSDFNWKRESNKLTIEEIKNIANILDAEYIDNGFVFNDGSKIFSKYMDTHLKLDT